MKHWFQEKFSKFDKDSVLKWVFIGGAGILTLLGGIFDTRRKDRIYEQKLDKEIEAQTKRLMEKKAA